MSRRIAWNGLAHEQLWLDLRDVPQDLLRNSDDLVRNAKRLREVLTLAVHLSLRVASDQVDERVVPGLHEYRRHGFTSCRE